MSFLKVLGFSAVFSLLGMNFVEAKPVQRDHIEVELVSELTQLVAGQPFWVGLRLSPQEHWHTYWQNPGDSGLETRIEWDLPGGSIASDIQWAYPERIDIAGIINYGYDGEVILLSQITPPLKPNEATFKLNAKASWLVCDEVCIPGDAALSIELPYAEEVQINNHWYSKVEAAKLRWPTQLDRYRSVYEVSAESVLIEIELSGLSLDGVTKIEFFPITADLIQYSSAQIVRWNVESNSIVIEQQKSTYLSAAPQYSTGLIVLTGDDGKQAYQLKSELGEVNKELFARLQGQREDADVNKPFLMVLFFAFLGGLILNLMPCVFPVLSLKALSLLKHSDGDSKQQRLHGLAYTFGVVLSFIVIAAIMLMLRSAGEQIGWGFQLQLPWFIALLIFTFFILAISLSGMLTVRLGWLGVGQSLTERKGYQGSFFTGLLAALVATPCTAPFMGPAMGYAVTQTMATALFVFMCLGLGMAFPFLLLSFVPKLSRYLPKPGKWMEVFKQAMAFPLYLTVVYLLWVLGRQTDINTVAVVLCGLIALSFAVWLSHLNVQSRIGKWLTNSTLLVSVLLILLVLLGLSDLNRKADTGLQSKVFSMQRLNSLVADDKTVFVNFTADWCITCKVNERVALGTDVVAAAFQKNEVEYLLGDWTSRDPEITLMLEKFNRTGVPLYLLYLPGRTEAQILPQILTPATVVEAIEKPE